MKVHTLKAQSRTDKKLVSMRWIEVLALGPEEKKDEAASILIDSGSPGLIEIAPEEAQKRLPRKYSCGVSCFRAYLPISMEKEELIKNLKKLGWRTWTNEFRDLNWQEEWKRYIRPVRIRDRKVKGTLLVKPTWKEVKTKPEDTVIEMDPGMAFGTGEHPTTGMCLRALLVLARTEGGIMDMFDLGTGSGILAIAGNKLGIKRVLAADSDPAALKVARANIKKNRAKVRVTATPAERIRKRFQLVTANINSEELKKLSPRLSRMVRHGGFLILSGILKEDMQSVKEAYKPLDFKISRIYRSGDWVAMVLTKGQKGR